MAKRNKPPMRDFVDVTVLSPNADPDLDMNCALRIAEVCLDLGYEPNDDKPAGLVYRRSGEATERRAVCPCCLEWIADLVIKRRCENQ